jgi:hypothetical protein
MALNQFIAYAVKVLISFSHLAGGANALRDTRPVKLPGRARLGCVVGSLKFGAGG